jgi:hypothetical protein
MFTTERKKEGSKLNNVSLFYSFAYKYKYNTSFVYNYWI